MYDDVYVFGHEDPAALSTFVQIHIQVNRRGCKQVRVTI